MKLSREQFDILVLYVDGKINEEEISKVLNYPLDMVRKIVKELIDNKLIDNYSITNYGLEVLENYRVKRAVFIAAGVGSRLLPITLNTPKPLIRVNGIRIIDTLIDACIEADIKEIYIVRGYLSEQFDQLLYKYPFIKFIENKEYSGANNIASALMAKDLLHNSYVFEADLLLLNSKIICKYQYSSSVLGIYKDRVDDWCLMVDNDNNVIEEKMGGTCCYQMVGIYYINEQDGNELANDIVSSYKIPGGKELYWEMVMNNIYKDKYKIYVRDCKDTDVVEIDTFNELKKIDKTYDV